jgi:hypothetical protein
MIKYPPRYAGYIGGDDRTAQFRDLVAALKAKKLTEAERERQGQARGRDFEATVDLVQRAVNPIDADTLAAKIIKSGQLRRAEIPDDRLLPKKGSVAWQILQAARKARNEDPLE